MILDTTRICIARNISESRTFQIKIESVSNVENIYELGSGSSNHVG